MTEATNYIYYIVLAAVVVTIIVVGRLKNSRIGLALQALREDEIACEAMGIDLTKVKLSAFALGSCWAGFAGVIFAAEATMKIGARFATNMAITCCRPNGMPFQKDTGASSEDNASKDTE